MCESYKVKLGVGSQSWSAGGLQSEMMRFILNVVLGLALCCQTAALLVARSHAAAAMDLAHRISHPYMVADENGLSAQKRALSTVTMLNNNIVDEEAVAVHIDGEIGEVSARHLAMLESLAETEDDEWEEGEFESHLEELLDAGLLGSDAGWL